MKRTRGREKLAVTEPWYRMTAFTLATEGFDWTTMKASRRKGVLASWITINTTSLSMFRFLLYMTSLSQCSVYMYTLGSPV